MGQARVSTTFPDNRLDTVVLSEGINLTYKFDLQSIFRGYLFGMLAKFFAQYVGPIRIVKNFDIVLIQVRCHTTVKTKHRNITVDHNPIVACQHPIYLVFIALGKQHRTSLLSLL